MKVPTISTSMNGPVNLLRATSTCNAFYIFFSAARAALFPFLTLFFRLLGLSAMETGIVMAAKTLTGFVWAPLWARCATAYNKRRTVLVFSLLMMGAMYMSFPAVYYRVGGDLQVCQTEPPLDHQGGNGSSSHLNDTHLDLANNEDQNSGTNVGVKPPEDHSHATGTSELGDEGSNSDKSKGQESTSPGPNGSKLDTHTHVTQPHKIPPSVSHGEKNGSVSSVLPTTVPHKATTPAAAAKPETTATDSPSSANSVLKDLLKKLLIEQGISPADLRDLWENPDYDMKEILPPDSMFTKEDIMDALNELEDESSDSHAATKRSAHRLPRNLNLKLLNKLEDEITTLTATLTENKLLLFLIVLLIVIFGEFFSSPVEKIADDAWFDFLERIDDMEKYGRQRYWGSLTFALVPIIVTCIVDYTPCRLMLNLHHFLLHFFVFGVFLIFTLLVAFYFPMPPPVKHKYSSKVGKGLRIICCDGRGFLFVVTLLVAGSVYASFHNFLFWHLQDLGSREVTMGLCVSIGAFAETPMLVFSNKLVRRFGHGGVASMSLAVLAIRLLYYGFLWTPWAVLPAEITNAFTHTALWYAVLSYEEFNVGSAIDRSIRSILSSMYFGLGYSVGSFVAGAVYQVYGASVLFWGASVLSGVWCLVYSLVQCCLPKKERVKYIKLLRKEEDDSSEGDDDWLEMALKEH